MNQYKLYCGDVSVQSFLNQWDQTEKISSKLKRKLNITDDDLRLTFKKFVTLNEYSKVSSKFSTCEYMSSRQLRVFLDIYSFWAQPLYSPVYSPNHEHGFERVKSSSLSNYTLALHAIILLLRYLRYIYTSKTY